eukprot:544635-Pelagomonas_calceolata.AAC.1
MPLRGEPDSALHILFSGRNYSILSTMVTERHIIASRVLLKGTRKGHEHNQHRSTCFTEPADPLTLNKGNREQPAPATAIPPASKARHPSQLLSKQRHIHLAQVKYCEDTRPKNQLEAPKQQHCDLCHRLLRASAQITLHTTLSQERIWC